MGLMLSLLFVILKPKEEEEEQEEEDLNIQQPEIRKTIYGTSIRWNMMWPSQMELQINIS